MKRAASAALLACALALGGCASAPTGGTPNPADPWEGWNRKVFAFNDAVDAAVLKPVAEGYQKVVPKVVRTGVGNVFGNIGDVWSMVNQFLQGKAQLGFEMGMRVLANTFFGFGGLFDPASEMGLTRRSEDFGQTLGRWGVPAGPFVMMPFLGPFTVRDTGGWLVDRSAAAPSRLAETDPGAYAITTLQLIDTRAGLLATTNLVGDVALDRYSFLRDAYLSRRLDQVYDGAPPLETFEDDPGDEAPKKKP